MAESNNDKRKKKIFKNFAEYWHFIKVLSDEQRRLLAETLPKVEQQSLKASYEKGGWEDLFMRNACDETLDKIKDEFQIDLLDLRVKVLSGHPQLMRKDFWEYINNCFNRVPWEHISYVFDGVVTEDYDEEYYKLTKYVPPQH